MHHILIVDDDKYMNRSLTYILKDAGYSVNASSNAADALKKLRNSTYDLLLLDYKLTGGGGSTGLSLFEKVREFNTSTKAIMISAFGERAVRERAKKLGIKYFLDKPFHVGKLISKIKNLLKD